MTRTVKKWTAKDTANCIITPSDLDHKYSRGVLGLITGSAQYPGAAVLTTAAASATGVGIMVLHIWFCIQRHLLLFNQEKLLRGLSEVELTQRSIQISQLGYAIAGSS